MVPAAQPRIRWRRLLGLVAAVILGITGVLGPMLLERWAQRSARRGFERELSSRLGAQVKVRSARPLGPFTLLIEGLDIRWPGHGQAWITVPALELTLRPAALLEGRVQLAAVSARIHETRWWRSRPVDELRRLARRLRRSRAPGDRRSAGAGLAPEVSLQVDHLDVRGMDGSRVTGRLRLQAGGIRVSRREGSWMVTLERTLLAAGVRAAVRMRRVSWRGRRRPGRGLQTRRLQVRSADVLSPGGDVQSFALWGEEIAPGLLQIHLSSGPPGRAGRVEVAGQVDSVKRQMRATLRGSGVSLAGLSAWMQPMGFRLDRARVGGQVRVVRPDGGPTKARGRLLLGGLATSHRRVAAGVVRWPPVAATGSLELSLADARMELRRTRLSVGGVPMEIEGELGAGSGATRLAVRLEIEKTNCQRIWDAVPDGLVGRLRKLRLRGVLGARFGLVLDDSAPDDLALDVASTGQGCQVIQDPPGLQVAELRRPFAFVIRPPGWKPSRLVMGPSNPDWRPYARLGRNVIAAFLAAEDRRFFEHEGFDLESIRRAMATDMESRDFVKGASSITQQVAKNVFLSHRRTVARKLQEAVLAWRLERELTKRRIMEIYLNMVEMGPGIFGVRAAARHYFQREPAQLDPLQAAHLAAITPNPRAYFQRFKDGRAGMDWLLGLRQLVYRMFSMGWLDRRAYEASRTRDLRLISYR